MPPTSRADPAAVDPRLFVEAFDPRHHLVEARRVRGALLGRVDEAFLDAATDWAEGEGLEPLLDVALPVAAVAARANRLRARPAPHAAAVTEVRLGEPVEVLDEDGPWRRVRTEADAYLGWIREDELVAPGPAARHRVVATRAHVYAAPRVQSSQLEAVAWGARLRERDRIGSWSEVELPDGRSGFLLSAFLAEAEALAACSPLEAWPDFRDTPYLWGGGSAWGIDCSGFVQLLFRMAGTELPRDADEQLHAGRRVEAPRPGDLALLTGHVGLYLGDGRMAHASGRAMRVVEGPVLAEDRDRERFLGYVRVGG